MDISIREFKNRLSEYLRLVNRGEQLVVTSHGTAVAMVQRVPAQPDGLPVITGVIWAMKKPSVVARVTDLPAVKGSAAELIVRERDRALSG